MLDNPMLLFSIAFMAFFTVALGIRILRNLLAPVRSVKATVVHKQFNASYSKLSRNSTAYKYAVTFLAEGKRLSFYVSEFSYNGYRKNETGTLTYKGDRIIDFS